MNHYNSMVALFGHHALADPGRVAVVFGQTALSYGELDRQSNRLGNYLRERCGIGSGDLVGIMLDRSEKMVSSILGVLRSGAAYVPIDPSYPPVRKAHMLRDAGIKVLLTQTEYIFGLDDYEGEVFAVDVQLEGLGGVDGVTEALPAAEDAAYVIYTSGSTGLPKGCVITHGNLSNYIQWANGYYFSGGEAPNFGLYTSLSFDLTVTSIFCCLTLGGRLVVYPQQEELTAILRSSFKGEGGIDSIKLTPSHINLLKQLDIGSGSVVRAIVGGEQLTEEQVGVLRRINPSMAVYNEYGPTEATVGCVVKRIEGPGPVVIGKPIANTRIYILGEGGMLCPIGVTGEICIGGEGLARGYLNRPELTAEKFTDNPMRSGERIYRTGDLGRWQLDGDIVYLGRRDEQVKVRGYRVELGEIEGVLEQHPGVVSVAVIARVRGEGERELVAYIVGSGELQSGELRAYAGGQLPGYMVPSIFVRLERLPLTPNGKLDRKALPEPEGMGMDTGVAYVAPRNETEEKFVVIWERILEKEKIGVSDSFFDLGGDSIKILRVMAALRKELDLDVPIDLIYRNATIERIIDDLHRNKSELEEKYKILHEDEILVRQEMDELKDRILSSGVIWDKENIEDIYPMSDIEKGMLFGSMLYEGSGIYHDQFLFQQLFFNFETEKFTRALALMVEKHAILRTSFNLTDLETEVQIVHREIPVAVDYQDLSFASQEKRDETIREYMRSELANNFLIGKAPLWRMSVFYLGESRYGFLWQFHHAILDGWSTASFITELNNLYLKLSDDPLYRPGKLKSDYRDFVVLHEIDQKEGFVKEFWRREMAGRSRMDLFGDINESSRFSSFLEQPYLHKIEHLAVELNTTVKAISLTAYLYMLYIMNGDREVLAGMVTNTRPAFEDGDKLLGCFLNTIPLRMSMDNKEHCAALIGRVHAKMLALKDKERLSLSGISLVSDEKPEKGNPFFDVLFDYTDFHIYKTIENDKSSEGETNSNVSANLAGFSERTNTYLDCSVSLTGNQYAISFRLNKNLFCGFTIEKVGTLYLRIMKYLADNAGLPMSGFNPVERTEQEQLLTVFNDTTVTYPSGGSVLELFGHHALADPGRVAVVFGQTALSYGELDRQSNRLGNYLRERCGIGSGDLVGIMLDRSEKMVSSILGVLRSGAAYVPIDPSYPPVRKAHMLRDAGIKVLLTQTEYIFGLDDYEGEVFAVDVQLEGLGGVDGVTEALPAAEDAAYVIYTSGSTGLPKGCVITHGNLSNYIQWANGYYFSGGEAPNFGLYTSLSFDLTVTSIFCCLTLGGRLVVYPQQEELTAILRSSFKGEGGIDSIKLTPSHINLLKQLDIGSGSVVRAIVGGEQLTEEQVGVLRRINPSMAVYNEYGPTEATVGCVVKRIEGPGPVVIGKPIANTRIYILGEGGMLCPIGVTGEICIGGEGLARGYLNRPELTAEKFTDNPMRSGERIYRTGDLGRWQLDGDIVYLGRRDEQVKVRGYRVELGEIEGVLEQHPGVVSVAVIARVRGEGERELVAYIVGSGELQSGELRAYAGGRLPVYMVPSIFVRLERLPLTPNGKLDRKALPEPEGMGMDTGVAYVAPRNETEEKLVVIWQEILDKEKVGVKDDFFESGGHSLKAIRLASQIHKDLGVIINLKDLFGLRTLEEQGQLVLLTRKTLFNHIPVAALQENYPLSSSQRRLWVLSQFEEGSMAYNLYGSYVIGGELDLAAFENAFFTLIKRHEILRTVFRSDESGETRQFIQSPELSRFRLIYRDLREEEGGSQLLEELVRGLTLLPFSLSEGPLVRAALYRTANDRWVITYVLHHIISDGWSMDILINELLSSYHARINGESNVLKPLRIQYKDYACWQQDHLQGAAFEKHKEYWLKQLGGTLPVLALPADKIRPPVKTYRGNVVNRLFPAVLSRRLHELNEACGTTLFMGLLAMVNALLYRYTEQEDIIIGSPIAGREHVDLQDQIGFYLNALALRTRFSGEESFRQLAAHVKQLTLDAYAHQMYPFDELIEAVQPERDMSRSPLFDVFIDLNDTRTPSLRNRYNGDLSISGYQQGEHIVSKFDLTFMFTLLDEGIHLSMEYNSDVYTEDTIRRMSVHAENILRSLVEDPDTPILQLEYMGPEERDVLLDQYGRIPGDPLRYRSVIGMFCEQAARTPDSIAVRFGDKTLSYHEINHRSALLGNYLREKSGIRADDLIGIMLDRSENMLIAILAVMRSGGAYVPIDPAYPPARKAYLLQDTEIKALITQTEYIFDLEDYQGEIFAIDVQLDALPDSPGMPPLLSGGPQDLVYVIYTSGSTGTPKGCGITNSNLSSYIQWANGYYFPDDAVPNFGLFTSLSFDLTVTSIFCCLTKGGCLSVYPQQEEIGTILQNIFQEESGIDNIKLTPSHISLIRAIGVERTRVMRVITGGEQLTEQQVRVLKAINPAMEIYNEYGPTEATVGCMIKRLESGEPIVIGRPISQTGIYLLGKGDSLCHVGKVGEICIGGAGLARGYLNQPELTARKFMENPFRKGERLYRTGDLGRWLADGDMEYLGRKDDQVKIRGHRVEPGEVESILQLHPVINGATVIARSNQEGEMELVAYLVSDAILQIPELRSLLSRSLPSYMLPAYFIQLDSLPLTPNGKLDRKRLPSPEGSGIGSGREIVAPRNETEKRLVKIWEEILGFDNIGVKNDFFDLGGHSLKATRLIARIKRDFTVEVNITDFFTAPTIESLAEKINNDMWLQTPVDEEDGVYGEIKI